ncbi:MAG: YbjQ family protein [Bacteroidaceae bacterium]|nr:YbjQ family protein [Bacteroidaceae bacterium]
MLLSTTPTIEGHPIQQYYGIVSGEAIIGAHFFKDIAAAVHDIFGGRAQSYENTLIEAKETAIREMSERAAQMGANAIVGIDLDYETIGQNASILMVSCNGTAVRI